MTIRGPCNLVRVVQSESTPKGDIERLTVAPEPRPADVVNVQDVAGLIDVDGLTGTDIDFRIALCGGRSSARVFSLAFSPVTRSVRGLRDPAQLREPLYFQRPTHSTLISSSEPVARHLPVLVNVVPFDSPYARRLEILAVTPTLR